MRPNDADASDNSALPSVRHRNIRPLEIPFVGRTHEMTLALEHLMPAAEPDDGRCLLVHGDSGTGKTFFVRELMRRLSDMEPAGLFLYIDIADDDYQSALTLASILKMALVPGPMTGSSVVSVPDRLSLEHFRRRTRNRGAGRGIVRAIAQVVGGFFGLGQAVSAAIGGNNRQAAALEDELASYLAWVGKRAPSFIAIDNLQFLNTDVRLTVESVLQRVGRRIRAVLVDRTIEGGSDLDPPVRCFTTRLAELELTLLTEDETYQLVASAIQGDNGTTTRLSRDIFAKTGGLAKDIEYCLRRYSLEVGQGARAGAIEGLLSTIDRLPLIHRQLLVIAVLLNGGVKKTIAQATVRRLATLRDEASLDDALDELIASEYLRLNGEAEDRLRPGHERIATAMRELTDVGLHEEVRRSLIAELLEALEGSDEVDSETYLLHCFVGLQTASELTRNLHYISRLVQSQFRQDQFSYLVTLSAELQDLLPLLPEHVLNSFLDAMQKSSAFEQGLQLVHLLDVQGVPGAGERRIYRLKYLTQAYQYDDALTLSEEIGIDGWGTVYRINVLMSLERNAEARELALAQLSSTLSECQAVLRRNTITLFDAETALRHLDEADRYFEREGSDFRLATVDTNRSLVYLHLGMFGDALRCLERALSRMDHVGSGEIFQAQMNLAIRSALIGDYRGALGWLDTAYLRVPRPLLLDQVKIEMDKVVIEALAGSIDESQTLHGLENCLTRIHGVQMPEVRNALVPNFAVLGVDLPADDAQGAEVAGALGMRIPIKASSGATWTLLMSAHWRY